MRLLLLLIFLTSCTVQNNLECTKDSDCMKTGCSGIVCSSKEVITTCEYKEEYSCYKLSNCGCINNKCSWEETKEFNECINKFK